MLLPIPVEPRLTQAGAGGDDRGVPGGIRCTLVEQHKILRSQHGDAIGVGLQVVEQADSLRCNARASSWASTTQGRLVVSLRPCLHGSGDPEAGDVDRQVMCRHELLHDGFQVRMVATRIRCLDDRF